MKKKLSLLLAGTLTLSILLCACSAQAEGHTPSGDAEEAASATVPAQTEGAAVTKAAPESTEPAQPSEEASPEPDLWDPEHRLDIPFTPAKGLELPVAGATGYASIELPLWEALPQGQEGKLVTIYAPPEPSPTPEPTPEPIPEPTPAPAVPSPEPAPEATQPLPEEPSDAPADAQPPEAAGDPAQTEAADMPGEPAAPAPADGSFIDPIVEPTPEPAPEPTTEPTPEPAPEPTPEPDPMEGALLVLEPGAAFLILSESGDWWQVRVQDVTGWIEHRYCLINLPDVIPSMIYNDTNSYSSVFVSSGKAIPSITGKALYNAKANNPRLGRSEFMMPVLYTMAKSVCQAQQNALAEGNTLVLYEGFRPYETQMAVVRSLTALSKQDPEVKAGISSSPWNISWFIATGASNHQEGYAIDVSLAKVTKAHVGSIGGCSVVQVDEYEEYTMPTPIHELSMAAATYTRPVAIFSATAWKSAAMAPAMAANEPARALQRYCTSAKLTPLASEWCHFNDLTAYGQIRAFPSKGNYKITQCLSVLP